MTKPPSKRNPGTRLQSNLDLLLYGAVFVAWYGYFFMTMQTPLEVPYDLPGNLLTALRLTVAAPLLIIWFLAVYAFVKIISYSRALKGSREETGFRYIAYGILSLLMGLMLPVVFNAAIDYFELAGVGEVVVSIIINYTRVLPYLLAFLLFIGGVYRLSKQQKIELHNKRTTGVLMLLLLIPAFLWLEVIFQNPLRNEVYHLRDSLIVLTIALPTLASWVLGTLSVISFYNYCDNTEGKIYARALRALVFGLAAVIIATIMFQTLVAMGSDRLFGLELRYVLAVIYTFLLTIGIGYLSMAKGAKRLTKIEVV